MKLLDALACKNEGRPPFWFMRQAGRYQPSYQALRKTHTIEEMFHTPELIHKVTLLPVSELNVDAAILFSDILIPLEMLGYSVTFPVGIGPQVETGCTAQDVSFVADGIRRIKKDLRIPLIGFCGGPYTVAKYARKTLYADLYRDPQSVHALLREITDASKEYLTMQIEAGVDVIQLFDSWAGMLPKKLLKTFSLPYLQELVDHVSVPVIVFSRNSGIYAEQFASLGPDALSVDFMSDIYEIRRKYPHLVLQGNLDPAVLLGTKESIEHHAQELLFQMDGDPGFIFNLGHGMTPDIPYENAIHLSQILHNYDLQLIN